MTVENGAAEAANDTAVSNEEAALAPKAPFIDQGSEGQNGEGGAQVEDEEEFDLDGEKYRIPRKLKEAIAKPFQQDYSRKTEEVAQGRKALDADREAFGKTTQARQAHFEEAAKVISFGNQIKDVEAEISKYATVDWQALALSDPGAYSQHRAYYDSLKDRKGALTEQRDTAARTWTQKEQEFAETANRERGERASKATAEIAKLVEGWAPGNELDQKLAAYGNSRGFSNEDMAELAIRNPKFVAELNRLRTYDEAEAKKKTQQTFDQQQAAKPVTRVGGAGGSATRKTTDSSGDALSMEEWAKREAERVAKLRPPRTRRA